MALQAVTETAEGLERVKRVRFVLFDEKARSVFEAALERIDNSFKRVKPDG